MTWPLLGSLVGLAALDSVNPATLVAVSLILLGSRSRPVAEALGFVTGAFLAVFVAGTALYVGAESAADALGAGLVWLRRATFGLAALVVLVAALRSLRARRRAAVRLPAWFNPATAVGLGVVMTGADLPNAFPYVIAIERLVAAGVTLPVALLSLAGYAVVYCLPCLALLAVGLWRGGAVRDRLRRLHDRFGAEGELPASPRRALALMVVAGVLATVAATA